MTASNDNSKKPDTLWLVLQPRGIFGIYADEDEARDMASLTGNVLTHVPVDGDYRPAEGT